MLAAQLTDGLVSNVILLADGADPSLWDAVACSEEVSIGWRYDGEFFSPPPLPEPEPPAVPERVTNRDFRVALLLWPGASGRPRFDEVDEAVRAAAESGSIEGRIALQGWEYANHVLLSELLTLRLAFNFSEAEVYEAMLRAAAVSDPASAG